jgi:hypothetical protein
VARHAAPDGSFGRSATGAAARGAGLLVVAVVLGIILLHSGSGDPYTRALRTTATAGTSVTTVPVATTLTVPLRAPADVKVLPANGTGTAGAAGRTGDKLKAAGYNVFAATNTSKQPVSSSAVYFKPGLEREARVIATLLALPDSTVQPMPAPPPVPDPKDADVVVVVGPDLAGKSAAPTPTTARRTTATTARPATTAARTATTKKP